MFVEILLFLGLIYLSILMDSPAGDSVRLRCTGCGHTRRGSESGANLLTRLLPFTAVPDRCPACDGIMIHAVEKA
jgi:hypothetical protein